MLIQIIVDHLFITGLIYFTGARKVFPITYIFSIIGTSIIFYKRGALSLLSSRLFFMAPFIAPAS
jgi:hypothetical protein